MLHESTYTVNQNFNDILFKDEKEICAFFTATMAVAFVATPLTVCDFENYPIERNGNYGRVMVELSLRLP